MNLNNFTSKPIYSVITRCIFIIVLSFICNFVWSQGNTVITYNEEDGLSGQNHVVTFIDHKGMLWTGSYTGAAVNYFDGSKWTSFDKKNGELPTGVNEICEDKYYNIWVFNYTFGLSKIFNGKSKYYKFKTKDLPGTYALYLKEGIVHLIDSKFFTVYYYDNQKETFIIDRKKTDQIKVLSGKKTFYFNQSEYGDIFLGDYEDENFTRKMFKISTEEGGKLIPLISKKDILKQLRYFFYLNEVFELSETEIKVIGNENDTKILSTTFKQLNNDIISLKIKSLRKFRFQPSKNQLIAIYELTEGHRYLLKEYEMSSGKVLNELIYHSDFNPNDVCKDNANAYWIATESNIQRILPYQFHISPDNENFHSQTWSVIQAKDGNLWMSSYGLGLARFDGSMIHKQPDFLSANAKFDDVSIFDKGKMIFNKEQSQFNEVSDEYKAGLLVFDGENPPELKLKGEIGFYLGRNNKGEIIRGTFQKGLWVLPLNADMDNSNNWFKIDSSKGMLISNVLSALQDKYGRYWIGRPSQGFAVYDSISGRCKNYLKTNDPTLFGIMSMDEDSQGNIWLGTGDGLYFVKNSKDLFENVDIKKMAIHISPDFIGNSLVNICKMYDKNTLVVGNLNGYYLIDIKYFYTHSKALKSKGIFKRENDNYLGGQTNQNGIAFDRDSNIWIVTSNGVYRHSPALFVEDTITPQLILDSMKVGSRVFKFTGEIKCIDLLHTERSLTIFFHHNFSPLLYDNVRYRYRLDSTHSWSILTSVDSINYQNLSPGSYNLQIQAIKNGLESPIQNISFTIDRVLWLKWWFWLGIGSVVSMVLLFLYNKQRSIQAQKLALSQKETEVELMSKEKDKLQVQAIVNQLNPHFINNALQWLQVRVDDDLEAVKVIGKLSENISTVFRNSRKQINYHSLKEEIQLTNNYLFIQKCRFGDKLNIEVPGIDTLAVLETYNVPIMMVQIHAENAIEHGIRNNDNGGGTVKIEVTDEGNSFIISVSDDGVGRDKSKLIGSKGTQNGTKMLSEIEKIFNKQNKLKISQQYIDGIYRDSEGLYYGTKVIITIPKQYNYII